MTGFNEIMELAKRRGFFWQSFSLYGGLNGFYDYAPLGSLLKDNIISIWKRSYMEAGAVFIDTPVVTPESVLKASGHLDRFADIASECPSCHAKYKLESLVEKNGVHNPPSTVEGFKEILKDMEIKCTVCGTRLTDAYEFNLMFRVTNNSETFNLYLRPETAQGIMVNFKLLSNFYRGKFPMAVAQVGKSFRNEISPRQGLIRMREFNQGEVEVFFDPEHEEWSHIPEGEKMTLVPNSGPEIQESILNAFKSGVIRNSGLAYFVDLTARMLARSGIDSKRLRFRQHRKNELAHYSSDCWDAEVLMDEEWIEVVGISDRGDYDLRRHQEFSGENVSVTVDGRTFIPRVVEPASGFDRILTGVLFHAYYTRDNGNRVLGLPCDVAPYSACVLPLMKKDGISEKARELHVKLVGHNQSVTYDESGSIGRRYARQDEIGTPYCITVDYQTMEDDTVTVRERDSTKQIRMRIDDLLMHDNIFRNDGLKKFVQSSKS